MPLKEREAGEPRAHRRVSVMLEGLRNRWCQSDGCKIWDFFFLKGKKLFFTCRKQSSQVAQAQQKKKDLESSVVW